MIKILFAVFFLNPVSVFAAECIGSKKASHFLVYLHGMDTKTPGEQEQANRKNLAQLAENLSLRIAIPRAVDPCPRDPHLICWGWDFNDQAVIEKALASISKATKECFSKDKPYGLIGFSNGGFVANQLIKTCKKTELAWMISIGAAGNWTPDASKDFSRCGSLKLLAGQKDKWNYQPMKDLATWLKANKADVELIEYNDGHVLPLPELEDVLKKLLHPQKRK